MPAWHPPGGHGSVWRSRRDLNPPRSPWSAPRTAVYLRNNSRGNSLGLRRIVPTAAARLLPVSCQSLEPLNRTAHCARVEHMPKTSSVPTTATTAAGVFAQLVRS
jgi:hypothetical protein